MAVLVLLAILVPMAPEEEGTATGCTPAPRRLTVGKVLGIVMLTVPLCIALSTSRDQFGAALLMNRTYVNNIAQLPQARANLSMPALPGEDPSAVSVEQPEVQTNANGDIMAEVLDLLYAAQLDEMRSIFEDKQIEVIGQLMPAKENNPKGDRYDLVRMFMTCCAADVQPIALPVQPATTPNLPDLTWVKVTGKASFPIVGGTRRPLVENAKIEKTDPPEETFIY